MIEPISNTTDGCLCDACLAIDKIFSAIKEIQRIAEKRDHQRDNRDGIRNNKDIVSTIQKTLGPW